MEKLKIAIQKSGRLSEKSMKLFEECGISQNNGKRKLVATSPDFPVEWLFLRDDDIPQYVYDGVADIGIVGENEVLEKGYPVEIVEKLGFARCKLSLAIPKEYDYSDLSWFQGKRIATSYPKILKDFFSEKSIQTEIHQISGSVEISPAIGLADGIFDIVSSGSTLISNGLKEVETVAKSEAVIIGKDNLSRAKKEILKKLLFRIRATQKSRKNKYVVLNAPNDRLDEIIELIPGMKSPTVMSLADEGWSSVHSVINEDVFWDVIDALKQKGAQGILVMPIEKMIV
ncbi:MAG TPA: ATP phosphoribosyltransferase [Bacteroidales bacterium]|nr:ATP phosphoribosyltransferase [Bacteroidales bacterium]